MSRESYNIWHDDFFPALGRSCWRRRENHKAETMRDENEIVAALHRPVVARPSPVSFWDMSDFRPRHCDRLRAKDSAPRSAAALPVRSIVSLRVSRGASWGSNQQHGARRRQISTRANLRVKKPGLWTGEYPSAISPGSPSPARQNSSWSSAPAAMPARRGAGCPATAARRPARSMPCVRISSLGSSDRRVA